MIDPDLRVCLRGMFLGHVSGVCLVKHVTDFDVCFRVCFAGMSPGYVSHQSQMQFFILGRVSKTILYLHQQMTQLATQPLMR